MSLGVPNENDFYCVYVYGLLLFVSGFICFMNTC